MKVLVVDPDPLFSRLLKSKLEKWGHRVTVAHDGAAAYELIAKEPFRMVIMDTELPGMHGLELCQRIRNLLRPRYTYIIFYADFTDKAAVMSCLEAGADDYLSKPLNTAEMQLRIKAGKRLLNMEDMLREGAGMDISTGVVNDASFREFFRVVIAESKRANKEGALLFVQVTNYGPTLSSHGFNPTETMMASLATLLVKVARTSDLVARLSDDTFCIMLQHTNWDKCIPVAERIGAQAPNLSVIVEQASIGPEVLISATNFPQGELGYLEILDESARVPYEMVGASGTADDATADEVAVPSA
ncbi:MAG: response regulator [Rhodospirillaceae bacterium]|jgi:diguanylate cyclase (GGDEF)-like protein|nr:response regulator [Rhodospirillaceae bacterium]MBT4687352.1 response regulator [Rhodospirillaceae bacterium]MBT5081051.1 response regulator [Rhodospirillaceae bacterium]MBT5523677.1 response regulator [Rhodospirillaceae bacterium]MBT5878090.1 response regulator [Rhodospirillaceae bacterium]